MAKIIAEKNASKKDVIAQKAAGLFKIKGYASTSMRELADAVGVVAPSLYNHISSKVELLQIICLRVAQAFIGQLKNIEKNDEPLSVKLEKIIRFHIQMMLSNFDEVYVADYEWKHLKEPFLSSFLDQRRGYEKRIVSIMESGMKTGEFKTTDPYVSMLTIVSAVRGIEFWHQNKKNISPQVLEDDMVNHLLKGIIK